MTVVGPTAEEKGEKGSILCRRNAIRAAENLLQQDLEPQPALVLKECSIVLGAAAMPVARQDDQDTSSESDMR